MSLVKPSLNERELLKKAQEQNRLAAQAELEKKQREAQLNFNHQVPLLIPASSGIPSSGIEGQFMNVRQPVIYTHPNVLENSLTIEQLQQELFKRKEELNKKVNNMTLDADHYRVNIPSIKLMTEDIKTEAELISMSGNIAVITGVPLIIVMSYLGEIYGFSEKIDDRLKKLREFYSITEVLNVKRAK